MSQSKHTVTEYRELVAKSLSSDRVVAKTAIKEINNGKYRDGELQKRVIFEYLPPDQTIVTDARRYENLLKLLGNACWSKKASEHKDELLGEAWRGLEHPDGMVRQTARRLFDQIRITTDPLDTPFSEIADRYIALLGQIEKKLKQYEPSNPPSSVKKAPPSIYKTLTLLWYDIADIPIVESKIDVWARMLEHDILPYDEPVTDDEPEMDDYDLSDWQENLEQYVHCDDTVAVRKLLKQREKQALGYLDWALSALSLTELKTKIVYCATYGEQQKLAFVLEKVLKPLFLSAQSQEDGLLTAFRYNKLARSIQYYENNVVHTSRQGTPFSREVVEAVYCADKNVKFEKVNVDNYLAGFDAAHRAIDEFVSTCILPAIKKREGWLRELRKISQEPYELDKIDLTEPTMIAHYLLDKLPTASYKTFISQEPRKIAATIWKIFANDNYWLDIPGLDNAELSAFGGWKGENGVNSSVLTYRMYISETVADPTIMYIVRDVDDLQDLREVLRDSRGGYGADPI